MKKPVVGAQLYTVRNATQTIAGIKDALRRISETGFTAVQISGFGPVDPGEVAKAIKDSGLTVSITHMGWNRFRNELDAVIKEHKMWGCRHTAVGSIPGEYVSADGLKRFVEELKPIAARLAEHGMDFSYHNHGRELARIGAATWLEMLYKTAPPSVLKAEIDTYWIQDGGGDPAEWVRKCAGRMPVLHVKDMCITGEGERRFAEIGEGNLNWPAILKAAEESGVDYLLVEQDNCYGKDPFECLATSYRNLARMGYK